MIYTTLKLRNVINCQHSSLRSAIVEYQNSYKELEHFTSVLFYLIYSSLSQHTFMPDRLPVETISQIDTGFSLMKQTGVSSLLGRFGYDRKTNYRNTQNH